MGSRLSEGPGTLEVPHRDGFFSLTSGFRCTHTRLNVGELMRPITATALKIGARLMMYCMATKIT